MGEDGKEVEQQKGLMNRTSRCVCQEVIYASLACHRQESSQEK